jgi:hypothetical protein
MGKKLTILVAVLVFVAAGVSVATAHAANDAMPFDRLKALVGEWEGKNDSGPVHITYTLVSGGSALMERMKPANEPEMITLYTQDGDHILVTHYCSQGNQPQMKSESMKAGSDRYSFSLVSVSGLKTPDEGHMVGLTMMLVDKDHLKQEWKYLNRGKTSSEIFEYQRRPEKSATIVPSGR